MRFWRRGSSEIEEPGLREKLAEQEGALESEQRHNVKMLKELRVEMQGKIDGVIDSHRELASAMLKRIAPKMRQKDLAAYIPNAAILGYGLRIMAQTDKDFGRAPVAAVSGDEVVYRAENFDRRCSLDGEGLCNVVRSALMSEDFDARKEYMVSRSDCDLFVSVLHSVYSSEDNSDAYLIRMVPLGAGKKKFARLGKSAVAHARKAMKKVITPDAEGDYAAE